MATTDTPDHTDAVIVRTHLVDDYETLRTTTLRVLNRQVDLLDNALHALRNGSPDVTDEFIERVRDAIDAQRNHLRTVRCTDI